MYATTFADIRCCKNPRRYCPYGVDTLILNFTNHAFRKLWVVSLLMWLC